MRIEVAGKLVEAFRTHIWDVDIADAATRFLVDILDIALYPLVVHQRIFVGDGSDYNFATTFLGFGVDGEFGEHAGFCHEERINIRSGSSGNAIDGSDIIAFLHI